MPFTSMPPTVDRCEENTTCYRYTMHGYYGMCFNVNKYEYIYNYIHIYIIYIYIIYYFIYIYIIKYIYILLYIYYYIYNTYLYIYISFAQTKAMWTCKWPPPQENARETKGFNPVRPLEWISSILLERNCFIVWRPWLPKWSHTHTIPRFSMEYVPTLRSNS